MLLGAENAKLYREHAELVRTESARAAYAYLIGWSSTLAGYECFPSRHGIIPDYRFYRGRSWDFAFIPNQKWILFYFRKPSHKLDKYTPSLLLRQIREAEITRSGEVTVRVASLSLAKKVAKYIES